MAFVMVWLLYAGAIRAEDVPAWVRQDTVARERHRQPPGSRTVPEPSAAPVRTIVDPMLRPVSFELPAPEPAIVESPPVVVPPPKPLPLPMPEASELPTEPKLSAEPEPPTEPPPFPEELETVGEEMTELVAESEEFELPFWLAERTATTEYDEPFSAEVVEPGPTLLVAPPPEPELLTVPDPNFSLDPLPPPVPPPASIPVTPEEMIAAPCVDCEPEHSHFANELAGEDALVDLFSPSRWGDNREIADYGLGDKQVPNALFEIDAVTVLPQTRLRIDSRSGIALPDRAEFLWGRIGQAGPPLPERSVDLQRFSLYQEMGSETFGVFTEIPLVSLDPEVNSNTTGLGDIVIGQKMLLTSPKNRVWQIAQVFRTILDTGPVDRGLGNGHTALEPGLLVRRTLSDRSFLHMELKYRIPLGADPQHSGEVLRYGFGIGTVAYQTDRFAVMPTLEWIGHTITEGRQTLPSGLVIPVDGANASNLLLGTRMAFGPPGDLGLFEIGLAGGFQTGGTGFSEQRVMLDLRWSY